MQVLLVNEWQYLDLSDWLLPTTNDVWGTIPMRFHSRCVAFLMEDEDKTADT